MDVEEGVHGFWVSMVIFGLWVVLVVAIWGICEEMHVHVIKTQLYYVFKTFSSLFLVELSSLNYAVFVLLQQQNEKSK